jgi:Flp pilus assembly protein TadG
MRRIRFVRRFAKNEKGGTLAELAILIPFLIVMAASVAELGRLFQTYSTLSKSTRTAARYLSGKSYNDDTIRDAKNLAFCGKTNCTDIDPVVSNLELDQIKVDPEWKNGEAGGQLIRVTVRVDGYNFQPMFNLPALLNVERSFAFPVRPSTTMYYMLTNASGAEGE